MEPRERLSKISGLSPVNKIDDMDDEHFQRYCGLLNEFVDTFPTQESILREALRGKDNNSFSNALSIVSDALKKISAGDLLDRCQKLKSDIMNENAETIEAQLTHFLATAAALSIDIQIALIKEQTVQVSESKTTERKKSTSKSILVVDDTPFILNNLKAILAKTEYNFIGVSTGAAALKYLSKHTPDLCITDIEMPQMNGYELVSAIREMGCTIPIMFLTSNSSKDYVFRAILAGAVDFVVKPIDADQVLSKIEKNLQS